MSIDLSNLKYAADAGEKDAGLFLGLAFFYGFILEKDHSKAFQWLICSADNGSMLAQYHLSDMYKSGRGIQKNYSKAFHYAKLAADQGFSPAIIMLAEYYEEGIGINKNHEKSNEILFKMVQTGNAQAALNLGIKFQNNDNAVSIEESIKWFTLADEIDGSATTAFLLATAYQKTNNNKKALDNFIKACDLGHSGACAVLAVVYSKGLLDVEINQLEAKKYSDLSKKANQFESLSNTLTRKAEP